MTRPILVTGGAGFIGSNLVLLLRRERVAPVVTLDKLTYAGNPDNLKELADDPDHELVVGDIRDAALVRELLRTRKPRAIMHLAAETHVDRSITGPAPFISSNVEGTFVLLDESLRYFKDECGGDGNAFRFLHVSTDEVFGSLGPDDPAFSETTPYDPRSPYSASKAASDHLARAYFHTYGLPVLITNCSNNYGPLQFPEKLIPLIIAQAVRGKPLPVYGDGLNVRDWLYVEDHCRALITVLEKGKTGETYCVGGECEKPNIEVVKTICALLDAALPDSPHRPHEQLISYVTDRPGHDRRYAMNIEKISRELGWRPAHDFASGLKATIDSYLPGLLATKPF